MSSPRRSSTKVPVRSEPRVAPPRQAERQHAKPGAGVKRSRNAMQKRSR
jgi:hypothetical protein